VQYRGKIAENAVLYQNDLLDDGHERRKHVVIGKV
jgi:hypothetical protein